MAQGERLKNYNARETIRDTAGNYQNNGLPSKGLRKDKDVMEEVFKDLSRSNACDQIIQEK